MSVKSSNVEMHVICAQCGQHSVYYDTMIMLCSSVSLFDFACPHCGGLYVN